MHKLIIVLLAVLAVALACKKEDPCVVKNPESVLWNPATKTYLISVAGTGRILSLKNKNDFSVFNKKPLSSPKGLAILDNTLYVADLTRLVGFDLLNGKQVFEFQIPGAKFLNDVVTSPDGTVYVSDTNANCIYFVQPATHKLETFTDQDLSSPNGLYYLKQGSESLLYIVSFRPSAPIQVLNLFNRKLTSLPRTEISLADGITRDGEGAWLISSWADSTVYKFSPDWSAKSKLSDPYSSPADISYCLENKELAIPEFNSNLIKFVPQADTINFDKK
jgi:sugar lactone lactonase YvrE